MNKIDRTKLSGWEFRGLVTLRNAAMNICRTYLLFGRFLVDAVVLPTAAAATVFLVHCALLVARVAVTAY